MIVASAVRLENNSVFVGKRHGDCYQSIKYILQETGKSLPSVQGFINDKLQFLTREEAYYEALENGQCDIQCYDYELQEQFLQSNNGLYMQESDWKPVLFSEDLW